MITGMTSTVAMMGPVGALGAIQAEMVSVAAANGVTSAAILPPGNEGASARALANQVGNAAMFTTHFMLGMKEMMELIPTLSSAAVAHEAAGIAGAKLF